MVTRDDLSDGGARHILETMKAIRRHCPGVAIEVLISDLGGNWNALDEILEAQPQVLNHNIETIPRLYPEVRPQADYERSLELLKRSSAHVPLGVIKSGLMLGLGETKEEVMETIRDMRGAGCHLLTLGQYLAPSERHHSVVRYIPPDEFSAFEVFAKELGFSGVASAPLVRSSYQADRLYKEACVPRRA
jgi:lipoic acid synthetase